MAGTTVVAVKKAIRTQLAARPAFDGVQVSYNQPRDQRLECVWVGDVEDSSQEPATIRQGRRNRDEEYVVMVHVDIYGKPTPEAADERAFALATELEEMLADDPKLENTPNVLWAYVSSYRTESGETTDGSRTEVEIGVTVRARVL